jgi:membrane fusion protein (multidrug efflux system)
MRKMLFHSPLLLLSTVFLLAACKSEKKENNAGPGGGPGRNMGPLSVEAVHIMTQPLSSTIEVPGSLMPFEETEIRSEISGRIVELNIKEGMTVIKGTRLVKLFDEDLQAQLRKLEVQLQIAQKTADRQRELLKIGGISQQEFDLSELQISNLKADIELVRVNITKTEIKAPYTGRLGLKNISIGAYISPSNLLTTLRVVDPLKLQFTVPEKYGSEIRVGQDVLFQIDGSNAIYQANVIATESGIEEETRSLVVRARVKALDRFLVPGAFAKVKMVLGREQNAILIPTQSVIPQGRKKQVILFKGGKAQFTDITTGIRDASRIQVLTGLEVGDTVITTGLLFLREGADVKISTLK